MSLAMETQKKKIHPYKFTLWVAMGSIIMMFAGLTSAYIVKRNQATWQGFDLPVIFSYSTAIIVASSLTIQLAVQNFKRRNMGTYRQLMIVTALLGVAFIWMQWEGFGALYDKGIKLVGPGSNVAASFLAVIACVHMAHVLGGMIAILVILAKALRAKIKSYDAVPVEVMATYWHFIGGLWIYLFIFLSTVN